MRIYTAKDMKKPCVLCGGHLNHSPQKYGRFHRVECEDCHHIVFEGKEKPMKFKSLTKFVEEGQ